MIACVGETEDERERGETEERPATPGLRLRGRRQPRRRLRAGLGDRNRQDGDAGDRAGGARVHQEPARRPRALRRLGQARQRRRAAGPAGRRRRARRRRVARRRIVHRDLPSGREHPLVALVILDGWGCAPPGPGNAVELADTPIFDRLWAEFPHTTLEASGEAVGLPPGQMGNSEVGHLTIGSGRVLFQDLHARQQGDRGRVLLREPGARWARSSEASASTCSGSSPTAASTRTSTTCARCSASRPRRPGSTRSPTVATSRRTPRCTTSPSCRMDRIATVAGRYYAMDRDQRWERTQRAFDAIVRGNGRAGGRSDRGGPPSYERGDHRRVHRADHRRAAGPGFEPGTTPRSSSTSGPTEPAN